MTMAIYSHSKIGCFETCPQKYKFQYVDKIRQEGFESVEAFLGSRVHETLEHLYKSLNSGQLLTEDETLMYYEAAWDSNWSEDVQIVEKGRKAEHYRKVGRQCVQDYYRHYQPFNQGRVLDTEKLLVIKLDAKGQYQMRGIVDRIDKVSDGVFEIHDYKTNRSLPSQEQKDQDRQLALYEIGLRDFLGGNVKKVALIWHFVRFDHEIRSFRTKKELEDLRKAMIAKIQQIESATERNDFPPCESNLCNWCEYRPLCPIWKHQYAVEEKATKPKALPDDGVALVNQLADLDRQRKKLLGQVGSIEEEMDAIKDAIIQYAKKRKLQRLFGDDRQATISHKTEWSIPTKSGEPDEYEKMVVVLRKSKFWPELTELSGAKLKDFLDAPEGRALQPKLAALIEREDKWRVSLRKKLDEK
jgi:putative RecB family exonuclease